MELRDPNLTKLAEKYQRLRASTGGGSIPKGPALAGLWLEQLCQQPLRLTNGEAVTVLQPGVPEKPDAPRLIEAAIRFGEGEVKVGTIALETPLPGALLTVVWEGAASANAPTIALRDQLLAPWPELSDLLDLPEPHNESKPATSLKEEPPPVSPETVLLIIRAAGIGRLQRKARRLELRGRVVGRRQLLWEELARALGYHRNQAPFRHLARRLPVSFLQPLEAVDRVALLFGVAGMLPAEDLTALPPQAQAAATPLWDRWWKARAALEEVVLPASAWDFTQIRPANRPERRLVALAQLLPHLERLERALDRRDAAAFVRVCAECHDPFWSSHATWRSRSMAKPVQLLGAERIQDLLLNLFWPLIALEDSSAAIGALEELRAGGNKTAREAWNTLFSLSTAQERIPCPSRGALLQQGLLELRRDLPDPAALRRFIGNW